ncbi:hypothetical protein F-E9_251 [Faustovirus]|nr:hypothetical protein F-E9_251 [Faustovirus]
MSSCAKVFLASMVCIACAILIIFDVVIMVQSLCTIISDNPLATIKACACLTLKIYDIVVMILGWSSIVIMVYIFIKMCYYLNSYKLVLNTERAAARAGYQQI